MITFLQDVIQHWKTPWMPISVCMLKQRIKMHLDCSGLFLWIILNVSILNATGEIHKNSTTQISACPRLSNSPTSLHFHAFEPKAAESVVTGCAQSPDPTEGEIYTEIHCIHVKNDRAATVYLTVNGIYHRTTKSLPHYKEYKYEFALFSNKDVTWLVTVENMPSNNTTYKFYISAGSTIINRDEEFHLPTVELDVPKVYSTDILNWCRQSGVFIQQHITSFSESTVSKIAKITITPLRFIDAHEQSETSFTRCVRAEENFRSPVVSFQLYNTNAPKIGCEKCVFPPETLPPSTKRAFILDLAGNRDSMDTVDVEIGGKLKMKSDAQPQTVVVLRSSQVTNWNVRVEDELRSHKFIFVREYKDKLNVSGLLPNMEERTANLDYSNSDVSLLINSTEAVYNSKVISYMQYDLPADLVFLAVSAHMKNAGAPSSQSENQLIAANIYEHMTFDDCDLTKWYITIPLKVLEKYGMSGDNLKFADVDEDCSPYLLGNVNYDMKECGLTDKDGVYETQLEILPKTVTRENDIFLPTGDDLENVRITLECTIKTLEEVKIEIRQDIKASCRPQELIVQIPAEHLDHIDRAALKGCKSTEYTDYTEYIFPQGGVKNCTMVYDEGVCQIQISLEEMHVRALYGDAKESSLSLSFRDSSIPEPVTYSLAVFHDYDLTEEVEFPVKVTSQDGDISSRRKTFHIKVSMMSNDPSLTVYLSRCEILENGYSPLPIIIHNCPADESVSFIRPYAPYSMSEQHFAVDIGKFLQRGEIAIQCKVSTCTYEEEAGDPELDAPTIPMCFHAHGDHCSTESILMKYKLASYLPDVVKSGDFISVDAQWEKKDAQLTPINKVAPKNTQAGTTSWFVTLLLGLAAFLLGCLLVFIIWRIDINSYRHPQGPRTTSKRCESNSSSGSSQSTNSTKTNGSSSKSLSCFGKSEKEAKPSSSKDDAMALKPLITSAPVMSPPSQSVIKFVPTVPAITQRCTPDIVQDDRHLYVSGGNGYLGMTRITSSLGENDSITEKGNSNPHSGKPVMKTNSQHIHTPVQAKQSHTPPTQPAVHNADTRPPATPPRTAMAKEVDKDMLSEVMVHLPHKVRVDDYPTSSSPHSAMDCTTQPLRSLQQVSWPTDDRMVPVVKYRLETLKEVAL